MSFVGSLLEWLGQDGGPYDPAGGYPGSGGYGGWGGTGSSDYWWQMPWLWIDPTNMGIGTGANPGLPGGLAGSTIGNLGYTTVNNRGSLYGGTGGENSGSQTGGSTGTGGSGSSGQGGSSTPPPVQTTDITGKPIDNDAIVPGVVPPISPALQQQWMQYLLGQIGQGLPGYPGPLNIDPKSTRLPDVWQAWQPWDGGTQAIASNLNSWLNPGKDPLLTQIMQWGGMGGPGHRGMTDIMQFGGTGPAAQYASLTAQFGGPSEAVVRPLADMAYGRGVGTQFLAPFLTGNHASKYQAPNIPPSAFPQPNPNDRKG